MKKRSKNEENIKHNNPEPKSVFMDIEPPRRYYYGDNLPTQRQSQNNSKPATKNEIRKKQNKKRKLKKSVRNAIISICVFLGIIVIAITLSLTMLFNIEKITITGSGTYSSEQIEKQCAVEIGDNLFLVDKAKCTERLTQSLPYIYDVNIKRKLPAELVIEVTEAVPSYFIDNENGTVVLLDDNLKVLENDAQNNFEGIIEIVDSLIISADPGFPVEFENENTVDSIKAIVDAINKVQMQDVTYISCVDKNNNSILYKNRIVFDLGDCNNLEIKLYKGLTACEELDKMNDKIKGTLKISTDKEIYFTEG